MDLLEHHMYNLNVSSGADLFTFVHGNARILDKHKVEITKTDEKIEIEADHLILATGSRPTGWNCQNGGMVRGRVNSIIT